MEKNCLRSKMMLEKKLYKISNTPLQKNNGQSLILRIASTVNVLMKTTTLGTIKV